MALVEEETEVCEDHPKLLPSVAVLEFTQQKPTQLVLQRRHKKKEENFKINIRSNKLQYWIEFNWIYLFTTIENIETKEKCTMTMSI